MKNHFLKILLLCMPLCFQALEKAPHHTETQEPSFNKPLPYTKGWADLKNIAASEIALTPARLKGGLVLGLTAGILLATLKAIAVPSQIKKTMIKFCVSGCLIGLVSGPLITVTRLSLELSDICLLKINQLFFSKFIASKNKSFEEKKL